MSFPPQALGGQCQNEGWLNLSLPVVSLQPKTECEMIRGMKPLFSLPDLSLAGD